MSETVAARWEEYNEAGRRSVGLGQLAEAEELFRAAVREGEQLGADSPHLATSLNALGQLRLQAKDLAEAERCFTRALAIRQQTYGPDSHAIVPSLNNLSSLHDARGETDKAVELLKRSLEISEKALGGSHPEVTVALNNLAKLYFKRRDFSKADRVLLRLLETKRALGKDHPEVATVLGSLAKLRQAVGKHGPAEQLWRQALAIRERAFAPDDPILATTLE
ncbi:MAG TPA: tetratricopeptide repeat protein, partial [Gemmatimonadaceae bacterium]|nr:tetratricopeptide repeat protein [Gemmatimonadaceae bacterium]